MTDIKKGDRVRVIIEGEVYSTNDAYTALRDSEGNWLGEVGHRRVTVEKIEPPVEVFKPGDVVREKNGGFLYAIGPRGYTQLSDGSHFAWDSCLGASHFTSREFERVVLG